MHPNLTLHSCSDAWSAPCLGGCGADEARMDQPRELDARDVAAGREDAVELPDGLRGGGEMIRQEASACATRCPPSCEQQGYQP